MTKASERPSNQAFLTLSSLLFGASAAVTIIWSRSMSMVDMPMPGGWSMSMTWMRMPGQSWLGSAASFVGMWTVMMVAMMLPSLIPMLWRYRHALSSAGETRLGWLTAFVGAGYFSVWTAFGMVAFPVGVVLAEVEMQHPALARAVPVIVCLVFLTAGAAQFTRWKADCLACCRETIWTARTHHCACCTETVPAGLSHHLGCYNEAAATGRAVPASVGAALRHGLRLGFHCAYCCAPLTAILLALGVMDLRVMAVVTVAITAERVAPSGERVARAIGLVAIATGLFLIARTAGLG